MTTLLVSHPSFLEHDTGPYHPERPDRLRAILAALDDPAFAGLVRVAAPAGSLIRSPCARPGSPRWKS